MREMLDKKSKWKEKGVVQLDCGKICVAHGEDEV